jgi:RNA polymerase sigma-70 factor, ECF subfamily
MDEAKMMHTTTLNTHEVIEQAPPDQVKQWVESARQGDLEAFNNLVLTYQDSLFSWACYLVDDPDIAADLSQSVFITAYEKIKTFRNGSFKSWLFQIAKNRTIDTYRSNQRHPTISLNEPLDNESGQDRMDFLEDRSNTPGEWVEQQEQAQTIHQLLLRLTEEYRSVLVLVDMNDMDYDEAAQALNVPLGTVKSRLARARIKLRELAMKEDLFSHHHHHHR